MKNINEYMPEKYVTGGYTEIEPGIFRTGKNIVTSISFQQEAELGEGTSSGDISQYPLEDILDEFTVFVSDFYPEQNNGASDICVLEFCSDRQEDIRRLRSILGRHVYNRQNARSMELVIE